MAIHMTKDIYIVIYILIDIHLRNINLYELTNNKINRNILIYHIFVYKKVLRPICGYFRVYFHF